MKSPNGSPNNSYIAIFGNTNDLSLLEFTRVFPHIPITSYPYGVVCHDTFDTLQAINRLAGVVKIADHPIETSEITPDILARYILTFENNGTFGISWYGEIPDGYRHMVMHVKQIVEQYNRHVRFVLPTQGYSISSVLIQKQHVMDLVVCKQTKGYYVGKTIHVQNFESWSKRDFGRPKRDMKIGMLPPKIARMAVNIALGEHTQETVVLDPFAGMGTILMESLLVGARSLGSDASMNVVQNARENIAWFLDTYNIQNQTCTVEVSDATHVSEIFPHQSISAIVTEPVMGPTALGDIHTDIGIEKAKNILKGLLKLYIGCLKDWHTLLRPEGVVVMSFPTYRISGREIGVKKLVDTCESLGYSTLNGPVSYGRPHATVKRQFYLFQKVIVKSE